MLLLFFEPIIKILTKIIESESTPICLIESEKSNKSLDEVDDYSGSDEVDANYNSIYMHIHSIEDNDKFRLFIQ